MPPKEGESPGRWELESLAVETQKNGPALGLEETSLTSQAKYDWAGKRKDESLMATRKSADPASSE